MRKLLAIPVATVLVVGLGASPAAAIDEVNSKKLRDAVTVNGILGHERVFQRIANQNGGTRASGTPGYAASANYVKSTLAKAGYDVSEQEFTFPFFRELAPATLAQTAPTAQTYTTGTFNYSGTGDVTGTVVAVDIQIPPAPTPSSTSGCEASDFTPASATEPQIALIQRGSCDFRVKAENAQAAGYDAVIIFNEGQPGRTELFIGDLGRPFTIPVVGLSFEDASALYAQVQGPGDVTVRVTTSTETDLAAKTTNVFAETPGGDADKVIVVGAHLDSVVEGPGINDNGSGSAAILEIAKQMAKLDIKPRQKVRFAFWGAEESGLLGSEYYVDNLPADELASIYANLNFDMLGSPNYVRFVYDGDGSDTPVEGPAGSAEIEDIFTKYFASQGLASEPTEFSGRSDYGPFIAVGIPAGGLFSGAEGVKTPEQAAVYGGTAGEQYDPCYHEACDDINNLSTKALHELGDAAAHAVFTLARTKTGFFPDGSLRARAAKQAYVAPEFDYKGSHAIR
ncbi:M28 family metallopeptidase [Spirilliplanes yamanashiensis]|uniref:Aminopeptidase n=1 Tax=Spirilliplanes yamanashiensis TaxID=42233 RepID=A0A8J3Y4J6_9ACTN|nr:M28 family metallopeptidase [Spirilliplanes yamanashiensis]MDP9819552.1 Zn-dependent M28 family amino/carboxypeptidase [Spirilliplanes yamanashiensis]GIJ01626.1 aminopeptidase [Spirilliplanes yamanashiensis]